MPPAGHKRQDPELRVGTERAEDISTGTRVKWGIYQARDCTIWAHKAWPSASSLSLRSHAACTQQKLIVPTFNRKRDRNGSKPLPQMRNLDNRIHTFSARDNWNFLFEDEYEFQSEIGNGNEHDYDYEYNSGRIHNWGHELFFLAGQLDMRWQDLRSHFSTSPFLCAKACVWALKNVSNLGNAISILLSNSFLEAFH